MDRYQKLRKFDEQLQRKYKGPIIGVDEVGMASLAGPVVACALILRSFEDLDGVDDCKVLSPKQRTDSYEKILPQILEHQIAVLSPRDIDRVGIHQAGHNVRDQAVLQLKSLKKGKVVIVDGNFEHKLPVRCVAIPQADGKSLTVAAASVLAKVTRDRMMIDLSASYPPYKWYQNKGYPTKAHLDAIQECGVTPYHRMSFAPVHKAMARTGQALPVDAGLRSMRRI